MRLMVKRCWRDCLMGTVNTAGQSRLTPGKRQGRIGQTGDVEAVDESKINNNSK